MMKNLLKKNFERLEKEVKENARDHSSTRAMVITTAVVGAGMYLLGRNKAIQLGYSRGRLEGYAQAVADVAEMIRSTKANDE